MPTITPKGKHLRGKSSHASRSASAPTSPTEVLTIQRLADDGRGIASYNGKTVFVSGALVGEKVSVRWTKQSSKYSEARIHELIESVSERIQPPCQFFDRCGACSVQYMPAQQQVAFKQQAVLSQLHRWGKIVPQHQLLPLVGDDYGYRQRVRLAMNTTKSGELRLGFREVNSHQIVDISSCVVLKPELQSCLPPLRRWVESLKPNNISHIELVYTADAIGIVVRHTRSLSVSERQEVEYALQYANSNAKNLKYSVWFQGEKQGSLCDVNAQEVDPRLFYTLRFPQSMSSLAEPELPLFSEASEQSPLTFAFHPQDFIQSNHEMNQRMVVQALELLAPQSHEVVVDLFCGIGNFSLPLAQAAKYVVGVEGVGVMVRRAQQNAANNFVSNVHFIAKDLMKSVLSIDSLNETLEATRPEIDALLLDPPRAGAKTVCENIQELSPNRIVYVSCDSATFSRDALVLVENGYALSHLGIMDMFPNTSHVEIMARFDRQLTRSKLVKKTNKTASTKKMRFKI